ncbi:MAG: hypothetical protein Q9224_004817, partial [Gallowayella concinna]
MPGFRKFLAKFLCGACAASKEEPEAPVRPVISRPISSVGSLPRDAVGEVEREHMREPLPWARQTSSVYSRPTASPSGSSVWSVVPSPSPVPSVSSEVSVWTLARVRERIEELERSNSPVPHALRRISEASGQNRALSPDVQ